jgi:hypothetical protein
MKPAPTKKLRKEKRKNTHYITVHNKYIRLHIIYYDNIHNHKNKQGEGRMHLFTVTSFNFLDENKRYYKNINKIYKAK